MVIIWGNDLMKGTYHTVGHDGDDDDHDAEASNGDYDDHSHMMTITMYYYSPHSWT